MKAIGIFEFGGPEALQVVELPEPHVMAGQVRIRVRAAAVNPVDVMLREGLLPHASHGSEPPFIPGMEVAGTIDEVGDGVTDFAADQNVIAFVDNSGQHGGYSEYVVLPAASVTAMPAASTFVQSASFLMNALTARSALDTLALAPGATLAVTGGAGAVGGYVIQLAAHEGLRVIADATESDEAMLRAFGATDVVRRCDGVTERIRALVPDGVDAVVDAASLHQAITPAIRDGGQILLVRAWDGTPERGIAARRINVRSRATDAAAIRRLRDQVEAGVLTFRVADIYPAEKAAEAHRRLEAGGVRGRLVLEF
jgi:NADPH:quinone reductase-like Zn-dependent oxidoreductase